MDALIGFADALQRIFPTTVASYLTFHGWIRQETLRNRSSVTFELRQCAVDRAGLRGGRRRQDGASLRRMPDGHQHHPVSPDHVRRQRHRNAERRGDEGAIACSTGARGGHDGEDQVRLRPLL